MYNAFNVDNALILRYLICNSGSYVEKLRLNTFEYKWAEDEITVDKNLPRLRITQNINNLD